MTIGVIGRKAGMTRVFTEDGDTVPVTVIEVQPNRVSQVKTGDTDGYRAVQVTAARARRRGSTSPRRAISVRPGSRPETCSGVSTRRWRGCGARRWPGDHRRCLRGRAEGRCARREQGARFAGGIRRHNFRGQDNTHGNSLSHRAPGSIGQCQTPGRVFKGKRMAGQMGNVNRCQQNLEVVRVDTDRNLLLVKGGVPGPAGGRLVVLPSVKQKNKG